MKSILTSITLLTPLFALSQQSTIPVEPGDSPQIVIEKAASLVPTANQLEALNNEFIAFVHFGPNTFTGREWGDGKEDPKVFDLKSLDTDQWCKAMAAAGMKMAILTAKHHDGFVLWQSRYTDHGIMSTNFRDGKGDILRDLANSCHKYGIKLGVYLSPADLYQIESPDGLYGNLSKKTQRTIPRPVDGRPFENKTIFQFVVDDYNEYFLNQLFELLTEYGPISEVWFDGAHPKKKGGQTYDYSAWRQLIRTLAPNATIFGREDIRWCGNEGGFTRESEWNAIPYQENPATMNDFQDLYGDLGSRDALAQWQAPYYLHYQPAETNTSIREGWFFCDDTYQRVRSADDVFDIYERSVGGNSIFLLNIPPNKEGRFADRDVAVLEEVGRRIRDVYSVDLLKDSDRPQPLGDGDAATYLSLSSPLTVTLNRPERINRLLLQEPIMSKGERIENLKIELQDTTGMWLSVPDSRNIGHKRIVRFPSVVARAIRLTGLSSRAEPLLSTLTAHYYPPRAPELVATRNEQGFVTIKARPSDFCWRDSQKESGDEQIPEYQIFYTTDLSEPSSESIRYTGPFEFTGGTIRAIANLDNVAGTASTTRLGVSKHLWSVAAVSSEKWDAPARAAIDENDVTFWQTEANDAAPYFTIDLGDDVSFNAFSYTPQTHNCEGLIESGTIEISNDGTEWTPVSDFFFGNLINSPTCRLVNLDATVTARYLRIKPTAIAGGYAGASIASFDLYNL
jgi:alpha-L-fucosidase